MAKDTISLKVSRDGGAGHSDPLPMASSTPLHHQPITTGTPSSSAAILSPAVTSVRNSTSSSELTNISTTDISTHDEDDNEGQSSPEKGAEPTEMVGQQSPKPGTPVALSDIVVTVPSQDTPTASPSEDLDESDDDSLPPPPPPSSLPPGETGEPGEVGETGEAGDDVAPSSPPPPVPTSPMPTDEDSDERECLRYNISIRVRVNY